ncbi:MAG: hypothetical protein AB7V45_12065 [Candidatus Krumholzibacteriia bacterium]
MDDEERRWLHTLYPELSVGEPLPAGSLGAIKLHFASEFARWKIHLPEDAVAIRRPGRILQAGWAIWYLFGKDEKGEYLDYYSAHRMTGDEHVRVYEDGSVLALDALVSMRLCSQDPAEDARLEAEHLAENRRIAAMLEAKGFGITGDEPGGVRINRRLNLSDEE